MKNIIQIFLNRNLRMIAGFVFVVLSCLTVLWCLGQIRTLKKENSRLASNLEAEASAKSEVETKAGLLAYQSKVFQLKLSELAALYPTLIDEIKNLKIKPGRAESILTTSYNSERHIITELKDSLIFDTMAVRSFNYADAWYKVSGYSDSKIQHVSIALQDTLVQVVYRGERTKPWLWIFSPRKLEQRVTLKNPSAKITYSKFIEIQKNE